MLTPNWLKTKNSMIETMYVENNLDGCDAKSGPKEVYIVKNTIRDGGSTALYTA